MSPERYPYNIDLGIEDLYPARKVRCDRCNTVMDAEDNYANPEDDSFCCYECACWASVRAELNEDEGR